MTNKNFHHGNLRQALIDTGLTMLNEKGVDGLSLRAVANALEVSSAAPFRHFKNKKELMKALAFEAGAVLTEQYEKAIQSEASAEKRLHQACMAYLNCAEQTPHAFKLMFTDASAFLDFYIDPATEYLGYKLFEELVGAVMAFETDKREIRQVTISCWALLHGFATLHLASQLETLDYKKEHAAHAVIALAKSPSSIDDRSLNI